MKTDQKSGNLGPQPEDTSAKIRACEGKEEGDDCHFMTDKGSWSYGKCVPQFLGSQLYCSDLNKTKEDSDLRKSE